MTTPKKKNRKQPIPRKRRLLPTITSKPKTQTIKTHLGKITKNVQPLGSESVHSLNVDFFTERFRSPSIWSQSSYVDSILSCLKSSNLTW